MLVYFFAVLFFATNAGLFFSWIDRKLTARLQWRVGPPLYQPWADFLKLLHKEQIIPVGAYGAAFVLAPFISFASVLLVALILPVGGIPPPFGFVGDLIVVLYLLAIPGIAAMIGGSASANPYGSVGASREMVLLLSYELPLIAALFTAVVKTGSLQLAEILNYQLQNGALALSASGFVALCASLLAIQAKLSFAPFDIPDAKTEIVAGPYTEYSGPLLALFRLAHATLLFVCSWLVATVFLGGLVVDFSSAFSLVQSLAVDAAKLLAPLLFFSVFKAINPRAKIDQALKWFWLYLTAFALIGLALAFVGW